VAKHFVADIGKEFKSPNDFSHKDLKKFIEYHFGRKQEPTPFISTTIDPLDVIHRGLRSENGIPKISIIDTSYIPQNNIFSMNRLTKEFGITTVVGELVPLHWRSGDRSGA
jgi:hypothetical protein